MTSHRCLWRPPHLRPDVSAGYRPLRALAGCEEQRAAALALADGNGAGGVGAQAAGDVLAAGGLAIAVLGRVRGGERRRRPVGEGGFTPTVRCGSMASFHGVCQGCSHACAATNANWHGAPQPRRQSTTFHQDPPTPPLTTTKYAVVYPSVGGFSTSYMRCIWQISVPPTWLRS